MYARVTTGQVDVAKAEEAAQGSSAGGSIRQQPGFRGNMAFVDRQTGKGIIIGLWETEADLRASMPVHQEGTVQAAMWAAPLTVEVLEVIMKNDPQ